MPIQEKLKGKVNGIIINIVSHGLCQGDLRALEKNPMACYLCLNLACNTEGASPEEMTDIIKALNLEDKNLHDLRNSIFASELKFKELKEYKKQFTHPIELVLYGEGE